MECNWPN